MEKSSTLVKRKIVAILHSIRIFASEDDIKNNNKGLDIYAFDLRDGILYIF